MSGSIEVFILLPMLLAAFNRDSASGAGAALGDVAKGLQEGGLIIADGLAAPLLATIGHIQSEYDCAYRTYLERSRLKLELQQQRKEDHDAEQLEANVLRELTQVGSGPDATLELLHRGLARLEERLSPLNPPPTDLTGAIATLRLQLNESVQFDQLLERYNLLSEQVAMAVAGAALTETTAQAIARLRVLLNTPLLAAKTCSGMEHQLLVLDGMQSQPDMVREGLAALQRRIEREIAEAAFRNAQWTEQMARLGAALTALSLPDMDSEVRAGAAGLRSRLSALLAGESGANLDALKALAADADAMYRAWLALRETALKQAIVEDNIRDVLQGMGYRVSTVMADGERALGVSLDDSVGVEISLDAAGRLHSEMVAYQPDQLDEAAKREEDVCALMDRVFEQLRGRKIEVREKVRRPLRHPLELKVARRPAKTEIADIRASESLNRTLEDPR